MRKLHQSQKLLKGILYGSGLLASFPNLDKNHLSALTLEECSFMDRALGILNSNLTKPYQQFNDEELERLIHLDEKMLCHQGKPLPALDPSNPTDAIILQIRNKYNEKRY